MKRLISFVVLLCVFVVILTLPANPALPRVSHPIPVWSILGYLAAVGIAGIIAFGMSREQDAAEARELEATGNTPY